MTTTTRTCRLCRDHYGDDGPCDEAKPVASPHRAPSHSDLLLMDEAADWCPDCEAYSPGGARCDECRRAFDDDADRLNADLLDR